MKILGISCYFHDAAAALVNEQGIVAAVEEERFTRIKHDPSFPYHSIDFCLKQGKIDWLGLDCVVFYEKPIKKMLRQVEIYKLYGAGHENDFLDKLITHMNGRLQIEEKVRSEFSFKGDFFYSEHHLSHAASAFYPSSFESAAILTVDGVGEKATTAISHGKRNEIVTLQVNIRLVFGFPK